MTFVQIMSYTTSQRAEMDAALQQWLEDTQDVRRARRRLLLKDREMVDSPARMRSEAVSSARRRDVRRMVACAMQPF